MKPRLHEILEAETFLNQFCKQVGLDVPDAKGAIHDQMGMSGLERIFSINFRINPNLETTTNKPFVNFFRELLESMRNSPLVKEEVKKVEDKLKMENHEIDQNREEIARLKKYETYYNMQYQLNHGKEEVLEVKK